MPFFFPPLRRGQRGCAPLDFTREGQGRAPHVSESPSWLDADINMHAARAARLRPALSPTSPRTLSNFERHTPDVLPWNAGTRIEIHSQFVGVFEIYRPHRMWMQFDTTEVHDPGKAGRVVDDDFICSAAGRK